MKLKIASFEVEAENMEDLLELVELAKSLCDGMPAKASASRNSGAGPFERFCQKKYKGNGQKMPFRFGSTSLKEHGTRENFFSAQLTEEEKETALNETEEETQKEQAHDDGASFF